MPETELKSFARVDQTIIDQDHESLRKFLNILAKSGRSGNADLLETIKLATRVMDWSSYHFSREEAFMSLIDYPLIAEHKRQHKNFIGHINRAITICSSGQIDRMENICLMSHGWYAKHIVDWDQGLAKAIAAHEHDEAFREFVGNLRPFEERFRAPTLNTNEEIYWEG